MNFQDVQQLFPSEDGNRKDQEVLLSWIGKLIRSIDGMKDSEKSILGMKRERTGDFYAQLMDSAEMPLTGGAMDQVVDSLLDMAEGHPYHTKNFVTNVLPMASLPGILGSLFTVLLNGNNLWDVYSPAGAEAEVKVIAMMSKLVGYDIANSWGYTTWGGQGAVFSGLRLAIAKQFPRAKEMGIPHNLYCFASEGAHYSLLKSVEATGIGSQRLIRVKTNPDHSMDVNDLKAKMKRVIEEGGIPVYVVATTGTTDSFGIDDVKAIKAAADSLTSMYGLKPVHIHADSALGGFYCLFNQYDFAVNPLQFEPEVIEALRCIKDRMQHLHLADSLCFDFQKLGQTPYLTSLFLVKNGRDFRLLNLEEFDTPYVGNRGYGTYHTDYTLECSRMASSIIIYAALLAFGIEGYQQILANYVRVNLAFRKKLAEDLPNAAITNTLNPGPITTFRFYQDTNDWEDEWRGRATHSQILHNNEWNHRLFEALGQDRSEVFFGDSKRQCLVDAVDTNERVSISVVKFFTISPYTQVNHIDHFIEFLKSHIKKVESEEGKGVAQYV